jgi:putative pyruvate formate lyase activating enzyme
MTDDKLWQEHDRLQLDLSKTIEDLRERNTSLQRFAKPEHSFLDLKCELANRMLHECVMCEWRCKVDRVKGERKGACHLDSTARVSTFFRHFGEEPPLVNRHGSGTIFFASCTFRCSFCQNWDISQNAATGAPTSPRTLSTIIEALRREGAANINFVGGEPTPNLHVILEALNLTSVNVPILWNSNMYLTPEAMKILADVVDIWLPDFKWGNDRCALKYSRILRYFEVTSRNHLKAHQNGDVIIRHLIMPGHVKCCTKPILDWIANNCKHALVNLMDQYRPEHLVLRDSQYAEIARRPTVDEIQEAYRYADRVGIVWKPVS